MRILIDPGHGGSDRANVGPTGYVEADGVLDIGLRLRDKLLDEGYQVLMTRDADETVSLATRAEMANEWQGQLLISLHTNAFSTSSANGIETYYSYNGEWGNIFRHEAQSFATVLQRRLIEGTGLRNRGIKTRINNNPDSPSFGKDYYYIIRYSKMPTVITEMGFHTNPTEEALLKTEEFREKLANIIYESVKEVYPLEKDNSYERRSIRVLLHGREREVEGLFLEGRHYVPIRFLEALGYEVEWDNEERTVVVEYLQKE